MICPKCEEGRIKKVILKKSKEQGLVCDYCETLWSVDEEIKLGTGRPFAEELNSSDFEYVLEEAEEKDQDHRDARFAKVK